MSLLKATTYLNKIAQAKKRNKFIGQAGLARRAKKAAGTSKRMECLGAQIANGHVPEDMNEYEKGYFFDD